MTDIPPVPESHLPLAQAAGVGAFTTIDAGGYPQSSAIWYLLDGDVVRTSLHRSRQKYRNLLQNPKATLLLIDPADQHRTLEFRGEVSIQDEDAEYSFLRRLLAHYGQTLESFSAPLDDRVVITLTPRRVRTNG